MFSVSPQPHPQEQPLFAELQALLCGQPMHFCPLFFALIIYATAAPIIRTIATIAIISPSFICHLSNVYSFGSFNSVKSILVLNLFVFLDNKKYEQSDNCQNNNPAYDRHPYASELLSCEDSTEEEY